MSARRATRERHPAVARGEVPPLDLSGAAVAVPRGRDDVVLELGAKRLRLTHLEKPFWPELGLTKGDLLRYYAEVADVLLPHLRDRALVLKRYPDGAHGDHFFMKRAPAHRPGWIATCAIEHASGNVIDFVRVRDVADLLWVVNLGCIDLNPWYAPCDDVDRPDVLHFDLDPVEKEPPVPWERICEVAFAMREALARFGMPCYAKTSGARGMHLHVPIRRGPTQKQVWRFARAFAGAMAQLDSERVTAEYRIVRRPPGRVLLDYNQNAWGRTLASVYSVRPRPGATVSTPLTWAEVEDGARPSDFHLRNLPERVAALGDLWAPVHAPGGRFDLRRVLDRGGELR